MNNFFDDKVLLNGKTSEVLYALVKDLPIIDYHCHLAQKQIAEDTAYENLGELWLGADHYKWRAMRMCGVDEFYITGDASWKEKFFKYAEVMPKLVGNPLYYWSHLELKQIFGINKPLNIDSAEEIYSLANAKLKSLSVRKFLKNYNLEYIATTDNPSDDLFYHKKYDAVTVAPTFRPDKVLLFDKDALNSLAKSADMKVDTYAKLKTALENRLDFFLTKGCKISDHGFLNFPKNYCDDALADKLYEKVDSLTVEEKDGLIGNLLLFLMREYKKRSIVVQMHFSVVRSVNSYMFGKIGADTGFDVTADECVLSDVIKFLDQLNDEERPTIVLYSLNPNAVAPLASICGEIGRAHV